MFKNKVNIALIRREFDQSLLLFSNTVDPYLIHMLLHEVL